jgi:hypothetical protein
MGKAAVQAASVPDWYLSSFESVQKIEGGLRSVELEICRALDTRALDTLVRAELEGLLRAIRMMKGRAVLVDMAVRSALEREP